MNLSNQQRKYLKSLAHGLNPVVRVGQHGLTDSVLNELDIALTRHELVKVKIAAEDRDARDAMLESMRASSQSVLVQRIGNVAVLYRANPEKPVISFETA